MANLLGIKPGDMFQSKCLNSETKEWTLECFVAAKVDKWHVWTVDGQIRHITTIPEFDKRFVQ